MHCSKYMNNSVHKFWSISDNLYGLDTHKDYYPDNELCCACFCVDVKYLKLIHVPFMIKKKTVRILNPRYKASVKEIWIRVLYESTVISKIFFFIYKFQRLQINFKTLNRI